MFHCLDFFFLLEEQDWVWDSPECHLLESCCFPTLPWAKSRMGMLKCSEAMSRKNKRIKKEFEINTL